MKKVVIAAMMENDHHNVDNTPTNYWYIHVHVYVVLSCIVYAMRHNLTWQDRIVFSLARQPLWVWNAPGIGFSPLGQLGVPVQNGANAVPRHMPGARLGAVHWGGAGGSGYMLTLGYTWSIGHGMTGYDRDIECH